MIVRFSNVVWWTSAAAASLMAIGGALAMVRGEEATGITLAICAILLGLMGRAVRYVLSGS